MASRRSLFGSVIALGFLLLTSAGCGEGEEPTPQLILEKAYASAEAVTSYHFTISMTVGADGMGEVQRLDGEENYLARTRYIFASSMAKNRY